MLDEAEAREEPAATVGDPEEGAEAEDDTAPVARKLTRGEQAEHLRRTVDTIGRIDQPGERIQKVISVGMLREGWDAKTVDEWTQVVNAHGGFGRWAWAVPHNPGEIRDLLIRHSRSG